MNRTIKFKMPILDKRGDFLKWHEWGFIDEPWGTVFQGIPIDPVTARKISREFTGLSDLNGKDIYEGDLIKCYGRNNDAPCEVMFSDGKFQGKYSGNSTFIFPLDNGEIRLSRVVVVGNSIEGILIQ